MRQMKIAMRLGFVLCAVSTLALTALTLQESALAIGTVKCLYGVATSGQGTISANDQGHGVDTWVYDVFASTSYQPSNNVLVTLEDAGNIKIGSATHANPSSYNLFAYGGGEYDSVAKGYRKVGVDVQLDTISQDGTFDAVITVQNESEMQRPDAETNEVQVDSYYD
jgi:hypothetical protein